MAKNRRNFGLLMWKNFTVRKRHWKLTLLVEILIPVMLFALVQVIRDFTVTDVNPDSQIKEDDTIYPIQSKEEIFNDFQEMDLFVYFVPENNFTGDLMQRTRHCLDLPDKRVKGFKDEDGLMKNYTFKKLDNVNAKVLGVVFKNPQNLNSTSKHLEYKIKFEKGVTDLGFKNFLTSNPFVQVQMCLDESFLKIKKPNSSFVNEISIQRVPSPANSFEKQTVQELMAVVYGITTIMAFLIPLSIEATYPANEKSIGVNILMSMNGVKNYQNLRSWLVNGLIMSTLYIIPRLILFKISFSSHTLPYLYYGNILLVAVMFFAHIAHLLAFGIHIASYFSKSVFRSLAIQFLYLGSFGLQMYLIKLKFFAIIPYLGILFPEMLLYRISEEIALYEQKFIGVGWKHLFVVADMNYNAAGSLGIILIFSVFGTLLHFSLALYASALFPGKYGAAKHPFYFLKSFKPKRVSSEEESIEHNYNMKGKPFEPVPKGVYTPGIQIRNLKKSYMINFLSGATHQALRGISIDFYKGQITTLLGHNGAGKTTMMSILTGLLSPTEGTVQINGKSISDEMEEIVTDLGLCPQEDILFPDLNVFEQIQFFGLLKNKNKTNAEVKKDVSDLLNKLKLTEKRNEIPKNLSGGQKRRVCLGMALIGDASTLILDEPTSGMDPETRRESWDILLKMRGEKTILISTHNMEEADVLGDRTAIVQLGALKSYGTPMFLKKFYGEGNIEVTLSTEDGCDVGRIKDQFSEESQIINSDGGKVVFSIPYSDQLPVDLDRIEENGKELGVTGLSVSLITLEQVFLRATKEDNEMDEVDGCHMERIKKVEGSELLLQSAQALFQKKFTYMRKNILSHLPIVLLPLLGVILMVLSSTEISDVKEIRIRPDNYRDPIAFYFSNDQRYGKLYKSTVESFKGEAIDAAEKNISDALLNFGDKNQATYINNLVAAASFEIDKPQGIKVNALYSESIFESIPITFNLISNTIIKALVGEEYQIDLSRQNLPKIFNSEHNDNVQDEEAYTQAIVLVFFLIPTFAYYVVHPLREFSYGIKDLQRMTGVTSYLYWGTFFLFDFCVFIISMIIMLIGLCCMDSILNLRLIYGTEIGIMILLLTLFAVNSLPFVYIFSFLNKKTGSVINILSFLPTLAIIIKFILQVLIQITFVKKPKLSDVLLTIENQIFMMIPSVSFYQGLTSFFNTAGKNAYCRLRPQYLLELDCTTGGECCKLNCTNGICEKSFEYFGDIKQKGSLSESILYLSLTPFLYIILLGLLEHKIIPLLILKIKKKKFTVDDNQEIDDQVKAEKTFVASEISMLEKKGERENMNGGYSIINTDTENNSVYFVYELSKYYGNLPAVKEISFSVKKSECFGLLGVNGAGKSTTFRMLTGEKSPNNGIMYLNGKEISLNRKEYLAQMGYCPQNSALIKSLNSKDHLKLFATLRGVPKNQVPFEVKKWIDRLNLNLCANQPSGTYSGGNKRRLSIAIALIGNPSLVLLDEPTTGVDPAARRSLWRVIKSCQMAEQSIILTSHSMEECEALCNRLVIMVKGQLVCIGPSEQLKQRFGAGYDINIKLNPERSDIDVVNIKKAMEDALECELRDEHVGYITYHVTNAETKWQIMYGVLKRIKEKYTCVEDFSVLSATLEQLFLQFAKAGLRNNEA